MPVELLIALFKSPAATGAVLPSSRALANAMAGAATEADIIVELGAGTGSVTRALIARHPSAHLIAVEIQPRLADTLQHRYPGLDVRRAPAKQVIDQLIDTPGRIAIVSSLPFRSLPRHIAGETADSLCRFLSAAPGRKLVQFTYQPRAPFAARHGLRWERRAVVWKNTPPAGVWELQAPIV
ncbi:MAG: class I SAM-dependent methyltransferase [Rhodocyclaceae bacterium]